MTKNYENPNCAAFFFDDGEFVNLHEVSFLGLFEDGDPTSDDEEIQTSPHVKIFLRGVNDPVCVFAAESEFAAMSKALTDALRIYHSKL